MKKLFFLVVAVILCASAQAAPGVKPMPKIILKILFSIWCLLFFLKLNSQTLEAHYKVQQSLNISFDPTRSKTLTLEYDGFLYRSGGRYIYFQKPLYLDKYPSGEIIESFSNVYNIYPLEMDTIQRIRYNNTDSMILRERLDATSEDLKQFIVRGFEWGSFEWKLLPETKMINGLLCQRAQQYNRGNPKEQIWDVWFCPDIMMNFGPLNIRDIPGLVVEAENLTIPESYVLQSYNANIPIPDSIFWPKEFDNAKFKQLTVLKANSNTEKTKNQKKAEIINQ